MPNTNKFTTIQDEQEHFDKENTSDDIVYKRIVDLDMPAFQAIALIAAVHFAAKNLKDFRYMYGSEAAEHIVQMINQ